MQWGHCSSSNMNRILRLQKRAARLILKVDINTRASQMFHTLGWLPIHKRIIYHSCIMVYKTLNNQTPDYITSLLQKCSNTHDRNLRSVSNDLLHVPRSRTTLLDRSFSVFGPQQWNKLPISIRNSPSLNTFKSRLKVHLMASLLT